MRFCGNTKNSRGFTLIEALVVSAIIFTLSAILFPNYRKFHYQCCLLRSAYKVAQDTRRAQEMATSAREYQGSIPPGYGIYLRDNDDYYLLYADLDGDRAYDAGEEIEGSIDLEDKVYIKSVSSSTVSINFRGPDPVTAISGGSDSVTITLGLEDYPGEEKEIFVNKAGLIYVKKQ